MKTRLLFTDFTALTNWGCRGKGLSSELLLRPGQEERLLLYKLQQEDNCLNKMSFMCYGMIFHSFYHHT